MPPRRTPRRVDGVLLKDVEELLGQLRLQTGAAAAAATTTNECSEEARFLERVDPRQLVDALRARGRQYVRKSVVSLTNQVRQVLDYKLEKLQGTDGQPQQQQSQLDALEEFQDDGPHMRDDDEDLSALDAIAEGSVVPHEAAVALSPAPPSVVVVGNRNSINSAMRNLYSQKSPKVQHTLQQQPPANAAEAGPGGQTISVEQWLQRTDNSSGRVSSLSSPSSSGAASSAPASIPTAADVGASGVTSTENGGSSTASAPQSTRKRRRERSGGSGGSKRLAQAASYSGNDSPIPLMPDDDEGGKTQIIYPSTTYADLGGIDGIIQLIRERIEHPLTHPEIYTHLGVQPPRGVLLHGPSGCGKTLLAHAIAGELRVPLVRINAPEIIGGMSGQSEAALRRVFEDARRVAPCLLFIDEIDAIAPKRSSAQREMERRIVAQLLTCMDGLGLRHRTSASSPDPDADVLEGDEDDEKSALEHENFVMVIAATSRPDSLDPALRVAGRFDREIVLGIPDHPARAKILQVLCRRMRLGPDCDLEAIIRNTGGYVGSDLAALTREAAVAAINRIFREMDRHHSSDAAAVVPAASPDVGVMDICGLRNGSSEVVTTTLSPLWPSSTEQDEELRRRIAASSQLRQFDAPLTAEQMKDFYMTMADFAEALKHVQPAAKREGFATKPDVSWTDIGAMEDLKEELSLTILEPIRSPELFERLGLSVPAGVLLYGPPGCGKTLIAKAVAHESGASFLSVKGPELLNQYVGESEKAVRSVFRRAQSSAPCIIFFDELDALCPKRGSGGGGGNNVTERVVNQLLTEMDGMNSRRDVFVIAATNRPDIIDPAMLRPGRLEKLIYVKLPDAEGRLAILRKHVRKTPLAADVRLEAIAGAPQAEGFSGADCAALVREATFAALKEAQAQFRRSMQQEQPDLDSREQARLMRDLQVVVQHRHLLQAFDKTFPSVSDKTRRRYDRMPRTLSRARAAPENPESEGVSGGIGSTGRNADGGSAGDEGLLGDADGDNRLIAGAMQHC